MKLTVSSAELLKGLMDVFRAIPAKTAYPILEDFLFVLEGDKLEITASDQELTLKTKIEVEKIEEEGKMAVPSKHITQLLKQLPDQPIEIKTVNENTFECSWNSGSSMLPYLPAEDYPNVLPSEEDMPLTMTIPAKTLEEGISSTIYATADDEIRPVMNGIYFDIDKDTTSLVATDSHKLLCYTATDSVSDLKSSFILHKKGAMALKSLLTDNKDEKVVIHYGNEKMTAYFGNLLASCRLITGNFPNYKMVIPKNNPNVLTIDKALLLESVKRTAIFANKASNHIKLDITADKIELSAQDLGFSIAAHETIPCSYLGDDLTIGFKSEFLAEILSNLECENVVIKLADKRRAAMLVPAEDEEEYGKFIAILMPIMVQ